MKMQINYSNKLSIYYKGVMISKGRFQQKFFSSIMSKVKIKPFPDVGEMSLKSIFPVKSQQGERKVTLISL